MDIKRKKQRRKLPLCQFKISADILHLFHERKSFLNFIRKKIDTFSKIITYSNSQQDIVRRYSAYSDQTGVQPLNCTKIQAHAKSFQVNTLDNTKHESVIIMGFRCKIFVQLK